MHIRESGHLLPMVFDPLDIGVIDATKLRETLLTVGECFTEKEAREFIKQANPTIEGKLPYERELIRHLKHE
ncbi:hypothetical protein X801_08940 [Opisthorchis viverrini]|uniref:Uncharacterized protein n=1 Tax=Opisthorchis viverrini TaxID=6198 RepID=A0A1S8WLC9_OPIVI|nr:hypothetical protein X801_08940 [Opisthorchis viverrini]